MKDIRDKVIKVLSWALMLLGFIMLADLMVFIFYGSYLLFNH
jgi:hypothetical protein